jgi:hypothetical protein
VNSAASADLAQFIGQYRSTANPDQVNSVYLDGGVLYEESERRERQRLAPETVPGAVDSFRIGSPQAHVEFLRDASGTVYELKFVLDSDGGSTTSASTCARRRCCPCVTACACTR